MKLNVYVFYNSYLECSGQPIFDDHEPDVFAKGQERALLTGELERVIPFENAVLYHLGSYDDEKLKFDLQREPLMLLRCSDVITRRKDRSKIFDKALEDKEKEGVSDVGKDNESVCAEGQSSDSK